MQRWVTLFFDKYIHESYFPSVGITDIVEILIIAVVVYEIMLWIKNTKAKCLTSLIFCMKAIVMLRWMQTIAGQFMKSLKTTMTISYMAMPAEKTVQNSLISKKSSRMVLSPAMDSAGAKNCKKKTKK